MSYLLMTAAVAVFALLAGVAVSDEVKAFLRWTARTLGFAPGEVQPSRPAYSWAEIEMADRLPLTGQAIECEKAPGRPPWELEGRGYDAAGGAR